MPERSVDKQELHKRVVMTLTVGIGSEVLVRHYETQWVKPMVEPIEEANAMHRRVVAEFRSFCKLWGVGKAKAEIKAYEEVRTTTYITEVEVESVERIKDTVDYEEES